MDSLQTQISVLNKKVDALHELTEQLSDRISTMISEVKSKPNDRRDLMFGFGSDRQLHADLATHNRLDGSMGHKDVLADTDYPNSDGQTGERPLSPEVQIQRLTAQLTAAYGRIAALEEQLLAQRIH